MEHNVFICFVIIIYTQFKDHNNYWNSGQLIFNFNKIMNFRVYCKKNYFICFQFRTLFSSFFLHGQFWSKHCVVNMFDLKWKLLLNSIKKIIDYFYIWNDTWNPQSKKHYFKHWFDLPADTVPPHQLIKSTNILLLVWLILLRKPFSDFFPQKTSTT